MKPTSVPKKPKPSRTSLKKSRRYYRINKQQKKYNVSIKSKKPNADNYRLKKMQDIKTS